MNNRRSNPKALFYEIIRLLFILLWSSDAAGKIIDNDEFRKALHNHSFNNELVTLWVGLIPLCELTAGIGLIFKKSHWLGLLFTNFLLFLFTGYIGLILTGYYGYVPCSCLSLFKQLDWQMHFNLNLLLLILSSWAFYYYCRFKRIRARRAVD